MSVSTSERTETRRLQVGLGDLALWVVGAAVYFALVRAANGFWMAWMAPPIPPMLDVHRVAGVALLIPAIFIALRLPLDAARRSRAVGARGSACAGAWRVAAAVVLVGLVLLDSTQLAEVDPRKSYNINGMYRSPWPMKLAALVLTIGTIGLLLGLVPARPAAARTRRRWVAASVVLAGVAGVGLLGLCGEAHIAYLILLALDAVAHAMTRPGLVAGVSRFGVPPAPILLDRGLWPSLEHRLAAGGLAASLALVACGLAAHWLACDLQDPGGRDRPRSWAGLLYRAATAVAAWGTGAYMLLGAFPRLHEPVLEGFRSILSPSWSLAIVAALLALAAGLSARGVAGPAEPDSSAGPTAPASGPALVRRLALGIVKGALVVALVLTILAALARLRGVTAGRPWWSPFSLAFLVEALSRPFDCATTDAIYLDARTAPEVVVLLGAVALLVVLFVRFLFATGEAPIDRIARDPRLVGRFLGASLTLTGVMLTLMPAFFLGGMALLHFALKAYYP